MTSGPITVAIVSDDQKEAAAIASPLRHWKMIVRPDNTEYTVTCRGDGPVVHDNLYTTQYPCTNDTVLSTILGIEYDVRPELRSRP